MTSFLSFILQSSISQYAAVPAVITNIAPDIQIVYFCYKHTFVTHWYLRRSILDLLCYNHVLYIERSVCNDKWRGSLQNAASSCLPSKGYEWTRSGNGTLLMKSHVLHYYVHISCVCCTHAAFYWSNQVSHKDDLRAQVCKWAQVCIIHGHGFYCAI